MSEKNLWSAMQRNMRGRWLVPRRHEDAINKGIPDVSFVVDGRRGWMELKHIEAWPVRDTTVVRCDHFTMEQREELRQQWKAAGMAFLFAQIDRDYMLFEGQWAADNFGKVVQAELFEGQIGWWHHRCDWAALWNVLRDYAWLGLAGREDESD